MKIFNIHLYWNVNDNNVCHVHSVCLRLFELCALVLLDTLVLVLVLQDTPIPTAADKKGDFSKHFTFEHRFISKNEKKDFKIRLSGLKIFVVILVIF